MDENQSLAIERWDAFLAEYGAQIDTSRAVCPENDLNPNPLALAFELRLLKDRVAILEESLWRARLKKLRTKLRRLWKTPTKKPNTNANAPTTPKTLYPAE